MPLHSACDGREMCVRTQSFASPVYLNDQTATIAEVLGPAGYFTAMAGKWHVGHKQGQWPSDRGFERFFGIHSHVDSYWKVLRGCPVYENGELVIPPTEDPPNTLNPEEPFHTTDVFTDWSLKYIDEAAAGDRPMFLYVAYNAPHWPLEAPDEDIERYRGRYMEGWEALRRDRLERMKQLGIVPEQTELSPSPAPEWEALSDDDRENLDFRRAIYAAQIDRMDRNIGRIIERLEQHDMLENTLVLFLSDNGCSAEPESSMFGYKFEENRISNFADWRKDSGRSSSQGLAWATASNTPFRKYKKWAHEGGIATPLIAHWPSRITGAGELVREPAHVIDLMATCLDLAGASYPEEREGQRIHPLRGRSLVSLLEGRRERVHEMLFWKHEHHAAVRDGRWKLVTEDAAERDPWTLHDLENDPTELNDLAAEHPERVERMKQAFYEWAEQVNALPWPADR